MKERPILFSGEMVRAILAGTKTQTRRIVNPQPHEDVGEIKVDNYHPTKIDRDDETYPGDEIFGAYSMDGERGAKCPYGAIGDRLWVRETFALCESRRAPDDKPAPIYRATSEAENVKWKPSIFMPRWASRITLEITEVRVQRLQDIGRDGRKAHDVLAEGITDAQIDHWRKWLHPDDAPAHTYGVLWDSINGKGSWSTNPWVWAITFKKVSP